MLVRLYWAFKLRSITAPHGATCLSPCRVLRERIVSFVWEIPEYLRVPGGRYTDNSPMNLEAALLNVVLFWLLTTPHEFAHAWVATRLGDDTPRLEGRVTLNPLAHVDWLGTVILPALMSLFGGGFLGWGRPVNTDPRKLRWGLNGLAIVALADPASNVVFAVISAAASLL